jgi:hypothetical protein
MKCHFDIVLFLHITNLIICRLVVNNNLTVPEKELRLREIVRRDEKLLKPR